MTKRILLIILFLCSTCFAQYNGTKPMLGTQLDFSHPLAPKSGCWLMNEGGGTVFQDIAGYRNGTVNSASWLPCKFGSGLYFDGVDDYASLPATVIGQKEFTIVVWHNASSGNGYILGDSTDGGNLFLRYGLATGRWSWQIGDIGATDAYGGAYGKWWQIVIIHDSAGAGNFYVNGILAASLSGSNFTKLTSALWLGNRNGLDRDYTGYIDHLLIYNRALSAAEVWQLYTDLSCMFVKERPELYVTAAAEEEESQVIFISSIARYSPFAIIIIIGYICSRRQLGRERNGKN